MAMRTPEETEAFLASQRRDLEADLRDEARPKGTARLVHAHTEFYVGGLRFDAGTYEIKRVGTPPADELAF